jgi:hypothetical protein
MKVKLAEALPLSPVEREQSLAASREVAERSHYGMQHLPHRRMSDALWSRFILAVRETGNLKFAAARADHDRGWATVAVYQRAMRDDVLRAREFQGAVDFWHAKIAREIFRRSIEGVDVPKFHDGQIVAYVKEFDSQLTRLMAAEHLKWIEKRTDNAHHIDAAPADDSIFSLSAESLLRMDSDTREAVRKVLIWSRADQAKVTGAAVEGEDSGGLIEHENLFDLDELAEVNQ